MRAKAYFLTPEEGGRDRNVDLRDPRYPYEMLADLGFGCTEDGFPICSYCHVEPDGDPGYPELGVEQVIRISLSNPGCEIEPGLTFDLAEGRKIVARCTVLSVLAWE